MTQTGYSFLFQDLSFENLLWLLKVICIETLERPGEKLHHPWEKARPYMGIKISLCRDVTVRETIELVGPFSKELVSRFFFSLTIFKAYRFSLILGLFDFSGIFGEWSKSMEKSPSLWKKNYETLRLNVLLHLTWKRK